MKKVILMKGLPGCGKTTFARQLILDNPNAYKRISKDDLRSMMDGGKWSPDSEKMVLRVRDLLILEALGNGKHVIVDDCNLHPKHEINIRKLLKDHSTLGAVEMEIKDFTHVPLEVCIERDLKRPNHVGEKVIRGMYNQFLKPKRQEYKIDPDKKPAIIVDIDGTIALLNGRGPYDFSRVKEDLPNEQILNLVNMFEKDEQTEYTIIFVSGRDSICRKDTEAWLHEHSFNFYEESDHHKLFMRTTGDKRKDSILKKEIFDRYIDPVFSVHYVIDDRLSVCRMWHSLGLTLLRVGDPDADF